MFQVTQSIVAQRTSHEASIGFVLLFCCDSCIEFLRYAHVSCYLMNIILKLPRRTVFSLALKDIFQHYNTRLHDCVRVGLSWKEMVFYETRLKILRS